MIHVYESATGLFVEQVTEGSDVSRFDQQDHGVISGAESVERKSYNYLGETLTEKAAVTLTPDKTEIDADDTDQAVVAVQVASESPPASIDIEVDGVPATVNLSSGQGQLAPITSPVEHVFEIRVSDEITYMDQGGCEVAAVEQE